MRSRREHELQLVDVTPTGDAVDSDDVLAAPEPSPGSVSRRAAAVAVAIAVAAGLAIGFVVGDHRTGSERPVASSAATSPIPSEVPVTAIPAAITDWLQPTGSLCGVQTGTRELQLGVQFVNRGPQPMRLDRIVAELPLGGLKLVSAGIGTACGQVRPVTAIDGATIAMNVPTWALATFDIVASGCPGPLPVKFEIAFTANGHEQASAIGGFSDLGSVRVAGC